MRFMYHASPKKGIETLEPKISKYGEPRVCFSEKRENTFLCLSNAIEKFCRETGFSYSGSWESWNPYGFTSEHKFQLQEYYPDAIRETYEGESAYIYRVRDNDSIHPLEDIPHAYYSEEPVEVVDCEYIKDAYEEILRAYAEGKIDILWHSDRSIKQSIENNKKVRKEYDNPDIKSDCKYFLECKFPWLKW